MIPNIGKEVLLDKDPAGEEWTSPNSLIDYGLLFNNSHELVMIVSPVFDETGQVRNTVIQDINPAFCEVTGVHQEDARGRLSSELFNGNEIYQLIYANFVQVVTTGRPCQGEQYFAWIGRHFLYEIYPLREGLIAIAAIDITEQKETQQALQENQARLLLSEEQSQQRAAQVEIQHQLIESREIERQQIANHLHEGLLQALIGIRYAIEESLGIDQKEIRLAKLTAVQANLQREIQNLRDYCNELRPPTLSSFGLEKTIRAQVEMYQRRHPTPEIHLELAADRQKLSEQVRMALFRSFEELFKSAISNPSTRDVYVRFAMGPNQAELEVADNGTTAAMLVRWADLARQGQLGLASALERVEGLGGSLQIHSEPNGITQIKVIIPIKTV